MKRERRIAALAGIGVGFFLLAVGLFIREALCPMLNRLPVSDGNVVTCYVGALLFMTSFYLGALLLFSSVDAFMTKETVPQTAGKLLSKDKPFYFVLPLLLVCMAKRFLTSFSMRAPHFYGFSAPFTILTEAAEESVDSFFTLVFMLYALLVLLRGLGVRKWITRLANVFWWAAAILYLHVYINFFCKFFPDSVWFLIFLAVCLLFHGTAYYLFHRRLRKEMSFFWQNVARRDGP